jgi:micrococcal nuclease
MSRPTRTKLIGLVAALVIVGVGLVTAKHLRPSQSAAPPGYYHVKNFIDGDTFAVDMNGTTEKVRFIGVDTPETHDPRKAVQCFGQAAATFTQKTIGTQPVRLQADPINTNRDRYNRLLRYIYLSDGTLLNALIIKQGYGFAYTSFPFTKVGEFRQYQKQAQAQKLGLWTSCKPTSNKYGGYTSDNVQ